MLSGLSICQNDMFDCCCDLLSWSKTAVKKKKNKQTNKKLSLKRLWWVTRPTMRSGEIVDRYPHFTGTKFYSGDISERQELPGNWWKYNCWPVKCKQDIYCIKPQWWFRPLSLPLYFTHSSRNRWNLEKKKFNKEGKN